MVSAVERVGAVVIVGRSSSHFTRVTRIFAAELGVDYSLRVVRDLLSVDPESYGGHPGLKVPVLQVNAETWFGSLNICRALARLSKSSQSDQPCAASASKLVIWPEDLQTTSLANAQELVLQAMATEVSLVMERAAGAASDNQHQVKLRQVLANIMAWLEREATDLLTPLTPERSLSYFEVTLFCLLTHLEFRELLPTREYGRLTEFAQRFSERASAEATKYRFDT
jgi:glutathione S-transferase